MNQVTPLWDVFDFNVEKSTKEVKMLYILNRQACSDIVLNLLL